MQYDNNMNELTFQSAGKKYRLARTRIFNNPPQKNAALIQQISPSQTYNLIYIRQLIQAISIADLRKLLAPEDHLHRSRDDEPIRIRIASLFLDGSLELVEFKNPVSSSPNSGSNSSSAKYTITYDDVDASHLQSPADLIINQQPSSKPVAKSNNEIVLDEQAQVSALVIAAEQGVALCEICAQKNN